MNAHVPLDAAAVQKLSDEQLLEELQRCSQELQEYPGDYKTTIAHICAELLSRLAYSKAATNIIACVGCTGLYVNPQCPLHGRRYPSVISWFDISRMVASIESDADRARFNRLMQNNGCEYPECERDTR